MGQKVCVGGGGGGDISQRCLFVMPNKKGKGNILFYVQSVSFTLKMLSFITVNLIFF